MNLRWKSKTPERLEVPQQHVTTCIIMLQLPLVIILGEDMHPSEAPTQVADIEAFDGEKLLSAPTLKLDGTAVSDHEDNESAPELMDNMIESFKNLRIKDTPEKDLENKPQATSPVSAVPSLGSAASPQGPQGAPQDVPPAKVDGKTGTDTMEISTKESKPQDESVVEKSPERLPDSGGSDVHMDRLTTKDYESSHVGDMEPIQMLETVCNSDDFLGELSMANHLYDQLALGVPKLPPFESEKAALPLKTCLEPHFDTGLNPTEHSVQLAPHIVTWMQQLVETPCHMIWDAEFQRGIDAYNPFRKSAELLCERVSTTRATCKAVATAAMKSFKETEKLYEGKPNKNLVLSGKATALCKWVTTRHTQARDTLDMAIDKHGFVRSSFMAEVQRITLAAYDQYQEDLKVQPVNETELFEQLDKDLEFQMDFTVGDGPGSGETPEIPETIATVPEAFQDLIQKTLADAGIPMDGSTHKALIQNLGNAYNKTLRPESSIPAQAPWLYS